MLRGNKTSLLDFLPEQSVGVFPDGQPDSLQLHGDAPFGACGGGSGFAAATQGDVMTKAKASKVKENGQLTSTTQSADAHRRPLAKSIKALKPKTLVALKPGKIDKIITMMRRPKGASISDLTRATAWQAHSVRGAISGMLRKKQGLNVVSERSGDVRLYRIVDKAVG